MRRVALAVTATAWLLLPATAHAGVTECRRLTYQIEHFEGMAERAAARGSAMWEGRTQAHVERLKQRRKAQCPQWGDADRAAAAFNEMLSIAASAAVSFFTFGAF